MNQLFCIFCVFYIFYVLWDKKSMEIKLLPQGYNLESHSSVAEVLINAFNDTRYTSFRCLVAFASYGGITAFTPHIQHNKNRFTELKFIIGIDQQGTSKEALEEILSWNINSYVYHSKSPNIFHPKIYIFEGVEDFLVIVGSNNFTESGLVKNIECSVLITHHKLNSDDRGILSEIEEHFGNLLSNQDNNLKPISNDLIITLEQTGLAPSEQTRSKRYDRKFNGNNEVINHNPFSSSDIQKNPNNFSPKRIVKQRHLTQNISEQREISSDIENWIGGSSNPILIAEIGGGGRWKQVNFPLAMFREFFGATAGDNSYHINLRYLDTNGELSEIENRQAVTVASQNYRFEIGAAQGAYPTEGRPIGVFIRVAPQNFIYRLYMPNSENYRELRSYLQTNYEGREDHLKRIIKSYEQVSNELVFLQF